MLFVRKHDILIEAPPEAVFDYVCNPHSWPEWLTASHKIEGPDRPLKRGQTFREEWRIRRGTIELHWTVTESDRPRAWTCEADTDFIGRIVIRYTFEAEGGRTRYTREVTNPARQSEPTAEQLKRMDEEARTGLSNIKRQVERRFAAACVNPPRAESTGDHAMKITVHVDPDKCQGHARCSALAPELFQLDEFGNARERQRVCVDPELIEKAYVARANCPEEAIIITEC